MSKIQQRAEAAFAAPLPGPAQRGLYTATDRNLHRLLAAFLVLVALWLLALGIFNVRHPSDWAMGDWLINYAGGFVRRGLPGELALLAQRSLHIPALVAILALQWILYAVILIHLWRAARTLRWSWWLAASVFSPATLAFVLLNPPYAFRKEILFLAILSLTLGFFDRPEDSAPNPRPNLPRLSLLLAAGCGVCMFAHEALLMYMPYLFAALYLGLRDLRRATLAFLPPLLLSAVAFAILTHYPGNAHAAQQICASVGSVLTDPPSGVCGGAIDYLRRSPAYAHAQVVRVMLSGARPIQIVWMFLLPMLPAGLGLLALRRDSPRPVTLIAICSAISWLLSASLFYYGTDWPRWVYIHAFCLLLLLLCLERQRQIADPAQPIPQRLVRADGSPRWAALVGLLIFCVGWQLTEYTPRPLYGSFVRFATHNLARGKQ